MSQVLQAFGLGSYLGNSLNLMLVFSCNPLLLSRYRNGIVQYSTVQYRKVQYGAVEYSVAGLFLTDCISPTVSAYCRSWEEEVSNWTGFYCTVLHCTAQHCTTLHCIALYWYVLHYTCISCTVVVCIAMFCTGLWSLANPVGWKMWGMFFRPNFLGTVADDWKLAFWKLLSGFSFKNFCYGVIKTIRKTISFMSNPVLYSTTVLLALQASAVWPSTILHHSFTGSWVNMGVFVIFFVQTNPPYALHHPSQIYHRDCLIYVKYCHY